jgi:hypothetical protein
MPLECESSGYDFKGRTPAGRVLAENRETTGKLTVYAQDIKTETRYGVYLIFRAENRYAGFFMGSLNADEKGKAEMRKNFDTSLLGQFKLSELVCVAVTASENPIVAPLCGYRENPVSWRNSFFIPANEPAKPEPAPAPEPIVEPEPEPTPEPEPEPIIEPEPEPVVEPIVEPEPEPTPAPKRKTAPRARKPKA